MPLDRIPPTTTAYVIATAIVAGITGYFIGQGKSLGLFTEKQGWPNGYDVKVHKDSSDEEDDSEEEEGSDEEDEGNGEELASFKDNTDEVKLVLVVRTDLGMTKGTALYILCKPNEMILTSALQVKCAPKLPMQPSPVTNTSMRTRPTLPFSAAGSATARPRSRCRSSRRMSCFCCRLRL
jgi:hypothetical protein